MIFASYAKQVQRHAGPFVHNRIQAPQNGQIR